MKDHLKIWNLGPETKTHAFYGGAPGWISNMRHLSGAASSTEQEESPEQHGLYMAPQTSTNQGSKALYIAQV